MTSKPKAVRFSQKEEEDINEFLRLNPFLDFSSLARLAINQFIKEPKINLIAFDNSKAGDCHDDTNSKHH